MREVERTCFDWPLSLAPIHSLSPQLGVLGFGLLVDGDVGIGVFPEGEKILIRLARPSLVTHHVLRAAKLHLSHALQLGSASLLLLLGFAQQIGGLLPQ